MQPCLEIDTDDDGVIIIGTLALRVCFLKSAMLSFLNEWTMNVVLHTSQYYVLEVQVAKEATADQFNSAKSHGDQKILYLSNFLSFSHTHFLWFLFTRIDSRHWSSCNWWMQWLCYEVHALGGGSDSWWNIQKSIWDHYQVWLIGWSGDDQMQHLKLYYDWFESTDDAIIRLLLILSSNRCHLGQVMMGRNSLRTHKSHVLDSVAWHSRQFLFRVDLLWLSKYRKSDWFWTEVFLSWRAFFFFIRL